MQQLNDNLFIKVAEKKGKYNWKGKEVLLTQIIEPNEDLRKWFHQRNSSVIELFGICKIETQFFIAHESFSMISLADIINNPKVDFPWIPLRLKLLFDIAKGIDFLHQRNLIHGELFSYRILIEKNQAKILPPILFKKESFYDKISKSNDIFSFGIIFWEISHKILVTSQSERLHLYSNFYEESEVPKELGELQDLFYICIAKETKPDSSQILYYLSKFQKYLWSNFERNISEISKPFIEKMEEEEYPFPAKKYYEKGRKLSDVGLLSQATPYYKKAADLGNPAALLRLDNLSNELELRKKCRERASQYIKWFEREARKGDSHAIYNIAILYERGIGYSENKVKAREMFRLSAEKGYITASHVCGEIYASDLKDFKTAMEFWSVSEKFGILYTFSDLAFEYQSGRLCPRDDEKALYYFTKAAEGGELFAQYKLGVHYLQNGDSEKAILWLKKAADLGYAHACLRIGKMYRDGDKLPFDREKALYYLKRAADRGLSYEYENLLKEVEIDGKLLQMDT